MRKRTSIIIMVVLITIILILLTILIYNLNRKVVIGKQNTEVLNNVENPANLVFEEIIETSSEEQIISPNTTITFLKYYKKCGHTLSYRELVSEDMVNLSRDEFSKLYSDWQINKFTSTEIELYKEFKGSCGEHYLVKSVDGFVAIYYLNDDNSTTLKELTEIVVKYLALEDINELENGIILYGKESLNSYIENFE